MTVGTTAEREKMRVLVTGATGLVGRASVAVLNSEGHQAFPLRRIDATKETPPKGQPWWDPVHHEISLEGCGRIHAVVHLAGDNIAHGSWTAEKKERMRTSRVDATKFLADHLAQMSEKPFAMISASAIGYYGNRGDYECTERASGGTGFLADLCHRWETATDSALCSGIRVVNLRIGVVLSRFGGVLREMLLPFSLGLGAVVGSGKQFVSWVGLSELAQIICFLVDNPSIVGPVNGVSPNPVTNREFSKAVGKALHRPVFLPMPAWGVKLWKGEMGEELLLSSTRVTPQVLLDKGYQFQWPNVLDSIQYELSLRREVPSSARTAMKQAG